MPKGDDFSTDAAPPSERAAAWTAAIADAYFPLELEYRAPDRFGGRLRRTEILDLGVSRLVSDPAAYRRRRRHLKDVREEDYLITLPRRSAVSFSQLGREMTCAPGGLLVERGDEPYRFDYGRPADLLVMKVTRKALTERLKDPDRFCATIVDATVGAGALLRSMLKATLEEGGGLSGPGAVVVRRQLLELLALTLDGADRAAKDGSSVRAAHLERAKTVIAANFRDPALSPNALADRCGVSVRYLHDLFRDDEATVAGRIREARLTAARDELAERAGVRVASVAYGVGFSDHAQFTRLFRRRFGLAPSDFARAAKGGG